LRFPAALNSEFNTDSREAPCAKKNHPGKEIPVHTILKSPLKSNIVGTVHAKWRVLGFLSLISLVTCLDRVNIAIAGPLIAREYGFDRVELGTIFSAFVLGYTLFQIPGGWLGDRFKHKKVLTLALVWWSIFTALTARAGEGSLAALVGVIAALWIVRFLIGLGEAATFPCANGLIAQWFGTKERGVAAGINFAGVGVGSALTPPFIAWLSVRYGWRTAFYVCGGIGILLALCFDRYVGDRYPHDGNIAQSESVATVASRQEPVANDEPFLRQIARTPWNLIFHSPQVWLLAISDFFHGYIVYIYFSWFYIYLVDVRGFSLVRGSFFAALPFLAVTIGAPLGGWMSDRLILRTGKVQARRRVAMGGLISAALLISLGATIDNAYSSIACFSLGAGSMYVALSSYWTTALEILPSHSATVSGIMNTGANLGGVLSPTVTPWIAARYGWVSALCLAAAFGVVAAILWKFIGTFEDEIKSASPSTRSEGK
jgi:ACS family glucarate transporter-like MFS transporter